ncbi:ATPase [Aureococcus anophagefferens]|nr:ATPase [Aureococcus anophagefferens]
MKKKHGYERQKRASFAGLTTKSSKLLRTAPVEHKENAPPLLVWHRLNLSYGPSAPVIVNCSGAVDRGNFVAVLGPSGSGKTSLIDLLSSRKTTGYFTGVLGSDGLPFTQSRVRHSSAYIPTIQAFPALLTVLETLTFVARLRCPRSVSDAEVAENSTDLLDEFGLASKASEYVGGTLASGQVVKGLSDGQKRRLAIARGVISRPSVVFADEPTRGLDAGATLSVMKLLGDLARTANIGVLCTIHQPHQTIWMFDRVYFLSAGYVMYDGPAADAVPWFGGLGYFGEQQLGSASPSEFTKTKLEFYDDVLMRCNMAAKDEETLQLIIFDAASFSTEIRELFVRILIFSVAITPSADHAYIVATGIFILGFVSSGYPVAVESMNQYDKWVRHYSTLKPPFDAFVRIQFGSSAIQDRTKDPGWHNDHQGNVGTDISIMLVTWLFFSVTSFFCMRFLYKHEH